LTHAVAARAAAAAPDPLMPPLLAALAQSDHAYAALTRELGVSERQARRRFVAAVGYGPRAYRRVARFQRFLALARRRGRADVGLARLAAEAGYADQAHLTREVVRLAGTTPGALLADDA
jgi:AraC-like DNA-binding protein